MTARKACALLLVVLLGLSGAVCAPRALAGLSGPVPTDPGYTSPTYIFISDSTIAVSCTMSMLSGGVFGGSASAPGLTFSPNSLLGWSSEPQKVCGNSQSVTSWGSVDRTQPITISFGARQYVTSSPGEWYGYYGGATIDVPAFTVTLRNCLNTGGWVSMDSIAVQPLTVTVSGPGTAKVGDTVTWTAAVTGGTPPYYYVWDTWPISDADGRPIQWVSMPGQASSSTTCPVTASVAETVGVRCDVYDTGANNATAQGRVIFGEAVAHAYTITVLHSALGLQVYLERDGTRFPASSWTIDTVQAPTGYSYLAAAGPYWLFAGNMDNQQYYDFHVHVDGRDLHIVGDVPPLGASTHQNYNDDGSPEDGSDWNSDKPTWGAWLDNLFRKLFQPMYDFFALIIALVQGFVSIFSAAMVLAGLFFTILLTLCGELFKILGLWASVWFVAPDGYHALASWLGPLMANGSRWLSGAAFAAAIDKYLGAVWGAVYPNSLFQLLSWAYSAWVLLRALLWRKPTLSTHWGNEAVA